MRAEQAKYGLELKKCPFKHQLDTVHLREAAVV